MARPRRLPEGAEQIAVYLTQEEHLALQVIQGRRKKRKEGRTSNSEVVADALWYLLEHRERMSRRQVEALLAGISGRGSKISSFPLPASDKPR